MFFYNIQALRGIASLLVFIIHLLGTEYNSTIAQLNSFIYIFAPGGVDIFFVISGFVVTLAANKEAQSQMGIKSSLTFMIKRIIRIYPLYWIVLITAFIVSPPIEFAPTWLPRASIFNLITLTYPYNYKVVVAWTLAYEMFFYLILSIAILFGGKNLFKVLFVWIFIEIIVIGVFNTYDASLADYIPLNPHVLQFATGCIVAYIISKFSTAYGKQIMIMGVFMFSAMCYVNINIGAGWTPWIRTLTLTLPSALIVYGAATAERNSQFYFGPVLQWFGNISFSLYIWHHTILLCLKYLSDFYGLSQLIPLPLIFILWASITMLITTISYYYIEQPCQKYLTSFIFSSRKKYQEA